MKKTRKKLPGGANRGIGPENIGKKGRLNPENLDDCSINRTAQYRQLCRIRSAGISPIQCPFHFDQQTFDQGCAYRTVSCAPEDDDKIAFAQMRKAIGEFDIEFALMQ